MNHTSKAFHPMPNNRFIDTYKTESNSLPECSLNLRMSGRTALCFPACIVTS